jgi:hypothetical protein
MSREKFNTFEELKKSVDLKVSSKTKDEIIKELNDLHNIVKKQTNK